MDGFLQGVFGTLCGLDWAEAEAQFRSNARSPHALEFLKMKVDTCPSFAAVLRQDHSRMDDTAV
jgi:hypothetical protein